jgi:transposase
MARDTSELSDEQWEKISPLLPEAQASPWGGPQPIPNRPCFEGILWILRTGARWKDVPKRYPSPSTCWRRLREWEEARRVAQSLARVPRPTRCPRPPRLV